MVSTFVLVVILGRSDFNAASSAVNVPGYSNYAECSFAATKLRKETSEARIPYAETFCVEVK